MRKNVYVPSLLPDREVQSISHSLVHLNAEFTFDFLQFKKQAKLVTLTLSVETQNIYISHSVPNDGVSPEEKRKVARLDLNDKLALVGDQQETRQL